VSAAAATDGDQMKSKQHPGASIDESKDAHIGKTVLIKNITGYLLCGQSEV